MDITGLSPREAADRLAVDGPNLLPGSEPKSFAGIVKTVLLEPMFLMLLAAGAVYLLLGDAAEALFLLGAVFAVIGLTLTQERKTQRALEALRDLSSPRALVRRAGADVRIASRDVVRGDLLVLYEGDRVAADAELIQGRLSVDESLLTGESVPCEKTAAGAGLDQASAASAPVGESAGAAFSRVFASTLITQGAGIARVCATGPATAVGHIGAALAATTLVPSRLQLESRRIVKKLVVAGLGLAVALVLLSWLWDGRPLLDSLLAGITLAMAILPEEIPVVLTVFLALGAWRLSTRKVLTRRVTAVEALGAITVLAVDKTGTLTLNRMQVAELSTVPESFSQASGQVLPASFQELARFAQLATPTEPFDPMEKAILNFCRQHRPDGPRGTAGRALERAYALTPEILAVTRVFATEVPGAHLLATKGAPEAVMGLCGLAPEKRLLAEQSVHRMASRGLRVLAVAKGHWEGPSWPESQSGFTLTFLGLVGLKDPPRPEAPAAVADCRRAGIRIIMMTGDHPVTARAIAQEVGLPEEGGVLTGADISAMDDRALGQRLQQANLCARLAPAHKLRLVRILQQAGEVVGMTGDGVNDAPALKAADIGIAMGERGTDVAREAAALVLLDDSFASITEAIKQGRRIYDNITAATRFIFAVHVPVIALALGPVVWHWPLLLLPVQIMLLELLIDPACSIVFEAEPQAPDIMGRPPRLMDARPFSLGNLAPAVFQGMGLAAVLTGGAAVMVSWAWAGGQVRATMFVALSLSVLLLVAANRNPRRSLLANLRPDNPWLVRMLLALSAMLLLTLTVPWLRQVVGLEVPAPVALAAIALMLGGGAIWMEVLRRLVLKRW